MLLASDLRVVPVLVCNGLLYVGLGMLNHALAPYGAGVSADGLFLIFPLHYLRLGGGLITAGLAGALAYAGSPLGADQGMFMLAAIYLFFLPFREGWRRDQPFHLLVLAMLLTFASHAACGVLAAVRLEGAPAWRQAFLHALPGTVFAGLAAPFWVELQRRLFLHFGVDLAAEPRRY